MTRTISVPAAQYADRDDCLAARTCSDVELGGEALVRSSSGTTMIEPA